MRTRSPIVCSRRREIGQSRRLSPPYCWLRVGGSGLIWQIGRPRYVATTRAATRPFVSASSPMERDSGRLMSRCRLEDLQRRLVRTRSQIVRSRQRESCRRRRSPPIVGRGWEGMASSGGLGARGLLRRPGWRRGRLHRQAI
jgi:hypothetical protein